MSDRIAEYTTLRSEHWPERYPGEFAARMRIERLREQLQRRETVARALEEHLHRAEAEFARLREGSDDPDALDYYQEGIEELQEQWMNALSEVARTRALIEHAEQRDLLGELLTDEEAR